MLWEREVTYAELIILRKVTIDLLRNIGHIFVIKYVLYDNERIYINFPAHQALVFLGMLKTHVN